MDKADHVSSGNGTTPPGRGRLILQAGATVIGTAATLGLLAWVAGRQTPTSDPFAKEPSGVSWQWFKEPLETNRFLRVPAVTRDLSAVTFLADGQCGWAVGNAGTILSTQDGGASWQPQTSGSKAFLRAVTFLADGQRGWAVGAGRLCPPIALPRGPRLNFRAAIGFAGQLRRRAALIANSLSSSFRRSDKINARRGKFPARKQKGVWTIGDQDSPLLPAFGG